MKKWMAMILAAVLVLCGCQAPNAENLQEVPEPGEVISAELGSVQVSDETPADEPVYPLALSFEWEGKYSPGGSYCNQPTVSVIKSSQELDALGRLFPMEFGMMEGDFFDSNTLLFICCYSAGLQSSYEVLDIEKTGNKSYTVYIEEISLEMTSCVCSSTNLFIKVNEKIPIDAEFTFVTTSRTVTSGPWEAYN